MNSHEKMSLTFKIVHQVMPTRFPVLEKKFAFQSSHLAICDMQVRQKLIKRFLAYRTYETQFAHQIIVREILACQKSVRLAIAFSLGVLNFLARPFDKRYARNLWDKMYKLYCNPITILIIYDKEPNLNILQVYL